MEKFKYYKELIGAIILAGLMILVALRISDTDQKVSIYTIVYQVLCNILYTAFGQANIEYDILAIE